jgi:hypothetical protein
MMGRVLWPLGLRMLESFWGPFGAPRHGDVPRAILTVPFQGQPGTVVAFPVHVNLVSFVEGRDKAINVRLVGAVDAGVVNNQTECQV